MRDRRKLILRRFLIAPEDEVFSDVFQHVKEEDSVEAVIAVLKSQREYPWDMSPMLMGNLVEMPDFPPTLVSAVELAALQSAYQGLTAEIRWVLSNYPSTEGITAEMERDAREIFIREGTAAICNLYGSGHKPILQLAKDTLFQHPNIRRTHAPEDLLQTSLERLIVHFYRVVPTSYLGYITRTIKTHARDLSRVESGSPIIEIASDPSESHAASAMPVDRRQLPPESRALITEGFNELKTAVGAYFNSLKSQPYRSRFQKLALLLLYELDEDISQTEISHLLGCSQQSITNWRKEYLAELPSIFKVLTQVW